MYVRNHKTRAAPLGAGISRPSFAEGVLSLSVAALTVKVMGLFFKLPLTYLFGDEGMGYFNAAYTVYSFFYMISTAGVPKALSLLVSERRGQGQDSGPTVRVALRVFSSFGLLLSVMLALLSRPISVLIGSRPASLSIALIAPAVFFMACAGVYRGALSGEERFLPVALSQLIETGGKLCFGLLFALLASRRGLPISLVSGGAVLGITFGSLLSLIFLIFSSKTKNKEYNTRQKSYKETSADILKRIFSVSVPLTLSAAVMSASQMLDLLFTMRRLGDLGLSEAAAAALYGNYTTLALPMFTLVSTLVSPVTVAALPGLSMQYAAGDVSAYRKGGEALCRTIAFFAAPATLGLLVFAEPVLALLYPDEAAAVAAPLLSLLAPAVLLMAMLSAVNTCLEAVGCVKAPLISMGIGSLCKLVVGYFLIGHPAFGIQGAPLGTLVCYAIGLLVSGVLLLSKRAVQPLLLWPFVLALLRAGAAVGGAYLLVSYACSFSSPAAAAVPILLFCAAFYLLLCLPSRIWQTKARESMAK